MILFLQTTSISHMLIQIVEIYLNCFGFVSCREKINIWQYIYMPKHTQDAMKIPDVLNSSNFFFPLLSLEKKTLHFWTSHPTYIYLVHSH